MPGRDLPQPPPLDPAGRGPLAPGASFEAELRVNRHNIAALATWSEAMTPFVRSALENAATAKADADNCRRRVHELEQELFGRTEHGDQGVIGELRTTITSLGETVKNMQRTNIGVAVVLVAAMGTAILDLITRH